VQKASYYRDQAERARRLAGSITREDVARHLRRLAADLEDIAVDLENGAVDIEHPRGCLRRDRALSGGRPRLWMGFIPAGLASQQPQSAARMAKL
jgi:hypothetical protein